MKENFANHDDEEAEVAGSIFDVPCRVVELGKSIARSVASYDSMTDEDLREVLGWEKQHLNKLHVRLKKLDEFSDVEWSIDPETFFTLFRQRIAQHGMLEWYNKLVASPRFDHRNCSPRHLSENIRMYDLNVRWSTRAFDFLLAEKMRRGELTKPSQLAKKLESAGDESGGPLSALRAELEKIPEARPYRVVDDWLTSLMLSEDTDDNLEKDGGATSDGQQFAPSDDEISVEPNIAEDTWPQLVERLSDFVSHARNAVFAETVEELKKLYDEFAKIAPQLPSRKIDPKQEAEKSLDELLQLIQDGDDESLLSWLDQDAINRLKSAWLAEISKGGADEPQLMAICTDISRARSEGPQLIADYKTARRRVETYKTNYSESEESLPTCPLSQRHTLRGKLAELAEMLRAANEEVSDLELRILSTFSPWATPFIFDGDGGTEDLAIPQVAEGLTTLSEPPGTKADGQEGCPVGDPSGAGESAEEIEIDDRLVEIDSTEPPVAAEDHNDHPKQSDHADARRDSSEARQELTPEPTAPQSDTSAQDTMNGAENASADEDFSDINGELCRPIWDGLKAGDASLAYQAALSIRRLHGESLTVPDPSLLASVALAAEIESADGEVATALASAVAGIPTQLQHPEYPSWATACNLLLFAAALRPSLVAPQTGASYKDIHLAGGESLFHLLEAVRECGDRLNRLDLSSSAFSGVRDITAWEAEKSAFLQDLPSWRSRIHATRIKMHAASIVWQRWIAPTGPLGKMIEWIGSDNVDHAMAAVQLRTFRSSSEIERLVDEHDPRIKKNAPIQASALSQLFQRADEVASKAERWLEILDLAPKRRDFVTEALSELSSKYSTLRAKSLATLEAFERKDHSKWQWIASAVVSARRAVERLGELFDPNYRGADPEPTSTDILLGSLVKSPKVSVDLATGEICASPEVVLEAVRDLLDGQGNIESSIDARITAGQFDVADLLVRRHEAEHQDAAHELRLRVRNALDDARAQFLGSIKEKSEMLEEALVFGHISEERRSYWNAKLVEAQNRLDSILDFSSYAREMKALVSDLTTGKSRQLNEATNRLSSIKQTPDNAQTLIRIRNVIEAGDAHTANEFLQILEGGGSLPDEDGVIADAFSEFFPNVARGIDEYLRDTNMTGPLIAERIEREQAIGPVNFSGAGRPQREAASRIVRAWWALKRTKPSGQQSIKDHVTELLNGIGFIPRSIEVAHKPDSERVEFQINCKEVADRALCPVPHYGSQARGLYRLLCVWGRPTDEDLITHVGDTIGSPVIVFYFGRLSESRRRELAYSSRKAGTRRRTFVVLDEILLIYLCGVFRNRLAAFFQCALPFTYLDPFVTTSGVVPPEVFFGRTEELAQVREPSGGCFVFGGRQLGKTALLREAERTFHAPDRRRYSRLIDLKAEGVGSNRDSRELWAAISREFKGIRLLTSDVPDPVPSKLNTIIEFTQTIREWCEKNKDGRILLLLDEADRFLEVDGRSDFQETKLLKNLMEDTRRQFKVVFAGLHNVLRTVEHANHPLAHFGEPINIGPLAWRDGLALIEQSFSNAGYVLKSRNLAFRMLAQTNYYPSLLQLYGAQLIRDVLKSWTSYVAKDGPRYVISDVDSAYRSKELRDAIKARFDWTLQLDNRYELVAFVIAHLVTEGRASISVGVQAEELRQLAMEYWSDGFTDTNATEFRILLDEMEGLGVLRHIDAGRYSLRNPNILLLMGSPADILEKLYRNRERTQEFEPDIFRAPLRDAHHGPRRSPLTFSQEWKIFRGKSNTVLIAGADASGIRHVAQYLKETLSEGVLHVCPDVTELKQFRTWLDGELANRGSREITVLLVPETAPVSFEWVRYAQEKVAKLKAAERVAKVIFIADSTTVKGFLDEGIELNTSDAIDLIRLRPWDDGFLRQWLDDLQISNVSKEERGKLAAVSGLWPEVLVKSWEKGYHNISQVLEAVEKQIGAKGDSVTSLLVPGVLPVLQIARAGVKEDEIGDYAAAEGIEPAEALRWLRWAELLYIVSRPTPYSWQLNLLVDRLVTDRTND